MTKKHFAAIASALAANRPSIHADNVQAYCQWGNDVLSIASTLESFNPRFDKRRFLMACGKEN